MFPSFKNKNGQACFFFYCKFWSSSIMKNMFLNCFRFLLIYEVFWNSLQFLSSHPCVTSLWFKSQNLTLGFSIWVCCVVWKDHLHWFCTFLLGTFPDHPGLVSSSIETKPKLDRFVLNYRITGQEFDSASQYIYYCFNWIYKATYRWPNRLSEKHRWEILPKSILWTRASRSATDVKALIRLDRRSLGDGDPMGFVRGTVLLFVDGEGVLITTYESKHSSIVAELSSFVNDIYVHIVFQCCISIFS